jgi:hypothetical protein
VSKASLSAASRGGDGPTAYEGPGRGEFSEWRSGSGPEFHCLGIWPEDWSEHAIGDDAQSVYGGIAVAAGIALSLGANRCSRMR